MDHFTPEDVESLQMGDKVGTVQHHSFASTYTVKTVTKRTKTLVVLNDGSRYNNRGRRVGSDIWHGTYLISAEAARKGIAKKETRFNLDRARKSLYKAIGDVDLTLPQCIEVSQTIAEFEVQNIQEVKE